MENLYQEKLTVNVEKQEVISDKLHCPSCGVELPGDYVKRQEEIQFEWPSLESPNFDDLKIDKMELPNFDDITFEGEFKPCSDCPKKEKT